MFCRNFGPHENVFVQTVGVAVATMPLAGGFVGILPALSMLSPPHGPADIAHNPWNQLIWSLALCYFGIFVAVPLTSSTLPYPTRPDPTLPYVGTVATAPHPRREAAVPLGDGDGEADRAPTRHAPTRRHLR